MLVHSSPLVPFNETMQICLDTKTRLTRGPNTEKRNENRAFCGVFLTNPKAFQKCVQTLSGVFDISSQPKLLKIEEKTEKQNGKSLC